MQVKIEKELVMAAEIVKNFIPKIVEVHNYSAASSLKQKRTNWNTFNGRFT
jgi:hypothetical protein